MRVVLALIMKVKNWKQMCVNRIMDKKVTKVIQ